MMFDNGWYWFGGHMWWLFILLILLVVVLIKALAGPSGNTPTDESALSILKKRYARGEIDEDEYQRMRKQLEE